MKEISVLKLQDKIREMVQQVNFHYPQDIEELLREARQKETNPLGKEILELLERNSQIAAEKRIPICQDTGMVIVFIEIGQEVHLVDGSLNEAIQKGVALGYEEGYLRKSIVADPLFHRINTQDNTPCIIYPAIVDGDAVKLTVGCKGFGSENMSVIKMLKPAEGVEGVKRTILDAIKNAGPNACPPMVVGVGIGGSFDYAAVLAKKATLRDCSLENPDPEYAQLERELLEEANQLDIGPQGLGGKTSVLKINIEQAPTHIAGLPVAVNISCHITRHISEVII